MLVSIAGFCENAHRDNLSLPGTFKGSKRRGITYVCREKVVCDKSYEINGMYPDRQRQFRKRERPGQPEHCKVQRIWVVVNDGPRATGKGYFLLGGHGNIFGD